MKDTAGWTPLHCAAYAGHANVVAVLLRAGADINEKDNRGNTALDDALEEGKADCASLLTQAAGEQKVSCSRIVRNAASEGG